VITSRFESSKEVSDAMTLSQSACEAAKRRREVLKVFDIVQVKTDFDIEKVLGCF